MVLRYNWFLHAKHCQAAFLNLSARLLEVFIKLKCSEYQMNNVYFDYLRRHSSRHILDKKQWWIYIENFGRLPPPIGTIIFISMQLAGKFGQIKS